MFTKLGLILLLTMGCFDVKPIRPPRPPGCQALVLQCQCDLDGENCHYVWVCEPRSRPQPDTDVFYR